MGILDRILGRKAVEPAPAMSKRAAAIINATRNYESALADRHGELARGRYDGQ